MRNRLVERFRRRLDAEPRPQRLHFVASDTDISIEGLRFEASPTPVVSIIITAYGGLAPTLLCLRSIAAFPPSIPIEVIVVEDASGDPEICRLANIPGLKFTITDQNLGYLKACNFAATLAKGEFLHFLNNDTAVTEGWLDAMLQLFERYHACGAVGSKLLNVDGSLQEAGSIIWRDGRSLNHGRGDYASLSEYNFVREVDYCSAASLLVRRDTFAALGGYDTLYEPAYYEDADLSFRLRARGLLTYYQPLSTVYHLEGFTHGKEPESGIKANYLPINRKKFVPRWAAALSQEHFPFEQSIFLARQRSLCRKVVLIVGQSVPRPDRDSASRRMMHFIETFLARGLVVKFWPQDTHHDPAYVENLEQQGVEVFYGHRFRGRLTQWLKSNGQFIDSIILMDVSLSSAQLAQMRSASPARIIFCRRTSGSDRSETRRPIRKALRWLGLEAQQRDGEAWQSSDVVCHLTVSETEQARSLLLKRGSKTLAQTIPAYAYRDFPEKPWLNADRTSALLFVGGFSRAGNVSAVTRFVHDIWPLLRDHPTLPELWIVGADAPPEITALANDRISVLGHLDDAALQRRYASARVAIAPLWPGAHVPGKVVESLHLGLPCVTTVPVATELAEADEGLIACANPAAFAAATARLLEDEELWKRASKAAHAFAKENFSQDSLWSIIAQTTDGKPFGIVDERPNSV